MQVLIFCTLGLKMLICAIAPPFGCVCGGINGEKETFAVSLL